MQPFSPRGTINLHSTQICGRTAAGEMRLRILLKSFTKQEKSWMMYDWANSAHSVVVVTILPIFYNTVAENTGTPPPA